MSPEVEVSCAGEIVQCKDLVEEVQSCLGEKRMEMLKAIHDSRRAIAEKFRYNIQDALDNASVIIEAEWRIRAFKLISRCCEHINANMNYLFRQRSDNEESSQNGVDDAISNLVHLARVFPQFVELRNLGKYLVKLWGERPESAEFHYLMRTYSDRDSEIENMLVQKIAYEQRRTLASGMVHVKMKFDEYRIIFQTLLFISEVCSYGLNLTAENNIIILVPILVLSATSFLFINIPLIRRCCRKRTVRVLSPFEWVESAFSEWVESSFSIFQLVADILKVAGHAESSSKVTETWVLVFAVIGYVFFLIKRDTNVDGGRSNRGGIRKWIRRMIKKIKKRYWLNEQSLPV